MTRPVPAEDDQTTGGRYKRGSSGISSCYGLSRKQRHIIHPGRHPPGTRCLSAGPPGRANKVRISKRCNTDKKVQRPACQGVGLSRQQRMQPTTGDGINSNSVRRVTGESKTPGGCQAFKGMQRSGPQAYLLSGRSAGNRITSRMVWLLVNSITIRSIPMPRPAVGGRPCSSAVT